MEVLHEGEPVGLPGGSAVAVGAFDGVHVGHQALLLETCRQAGNLGATPMVAIFDRHPVSWYERSDGSVWPAVINLGTRPTFYDENGLRLLEAHLLDFDGDLYGERAKVRFARWLRGEVKFPGIDALVEQLDRDVKAARAVLA